MSRDLRELESETLDLAQDFLNRAQAECPEASLIVTSTYRTFDEQTALYAQGRTTPGRIVTHAKAGESAHNYRLAFDVAFTINAKLVWDDHHPVWHQLGLLGVACGLEWGGNWQTFVEFPHFQHPNWRQFTGAQP